MRTTQWLRFRGLNIALAIATLQLAQSILNTAGAADSPIVTRFDGGRSDFANSIATDLMGNAYIGGEVDDANSMREFSVLKYDSNGALQWTAKYLNALHGTDSGGVRSIAVDTAGNVYAAGFVYTRVTQFLVNMDWLVVSYSPDGVERWSHRVNGTSNVWDNAGSVAVDATGNVLVAGSIDDVTSGGQNGWTLIKYSPNGVPIWRRTDLRTDSTVDGLGNLHVDPNGNIVGIGFNTMATNPQHKIVTTKVDSNGNVLWRRLYSDTSVSDDFVADMDIDVSGNIYVTGETVASTNFELPHVPLTLKYASTGSLSWVLHGDGAGGTSVIVDAFGDVVVSGESVREGGGQGVIATAKYDPTGARKWLVEGVTGTLEADSVGNIYSFASRLNPSSGNFSDLMTSKITTSGTLSWQHRFDGGWDTSSRDDAIASSVDAFDNLFAVGNAQVNAVNDFVMLRYAANVTPQQTPTSVNAPTGLAAAASSGRVALTWLDNSNNEANFVIERCVAKNCTAFAQLVQVTANATSYTDTAVSKSTTYRYRVRGVNGPTTSPYSNIISATTPKK
jgi:hypothetical protein